MTTARELDCLRLIYEKSSSGWPVRLADIAKSMSVKPPTALAMTEKLVRNGLLVKGPSGYVLTSEGKREAENLVMAHRVIETLLYKAGLSPDEACVQARKFDTFIPQLVVKKLYDYLGKPSECPHGKEIAC
ncbi:MAG: metal-dependent transcriptional regulator [Thermoprotei archaeon]